MADIYEYLTQDLYATADPSSATTSSAPASVAQAATASGETSSESIVSGQVDGNIEMVGGFIQSKNFVTGSAGWRINSDGSVEFASGYFRGDISGATGTFSGTVTVGSLNIPNTTSANSMHVDSNGNTWWGANVASGYAGAPAYILNTGAAVFQNVAIGGTTIQYVITNAGIFSYGDGADGTVTISVDTTLTSDMYYDVLTVNAGVTLNPGGYRIFAKTRATINGSIARNGNNGANASSGGGGAGGAALADGYLKGSSAGGSGGNSPSDGSGGDNGGNGTAAANSLGSTGFAGGHGGDRNGGVLLGGSGGTAGSFTAANVALKVGVQLATLLDIGSTGATVKYNNSSGSGGGGGGAGGGGGTGFRGGGGGGAGSDGGIIAIYARDLVIGAAGSITANGGNGGNGADANQAVAPGVGGGGSAGNGGVVILVYNTFTNSGSITVTAGTKGVKGTVGNLTNATDGTNGSTGTIYQFQLSL